MSRDLRATLREYRLTSLVILLLLVLSVYAFFLILVGEFWTPFFGAQSSSIIFFSLVFIGVAILLAGRGVPDLETFSIALATTVSAIWLYELIYHYSFPVYFNYFRFPFFDFNDAHTLLLEGATSLLVLAGYKYARLRGNNVFWLLVLAFFATYTAWLLIGFPQFDGTFTLPRYLQVGNPFFAGYILNRVSKLLLCLSWVALYLR